MKSLTVTASTLKVYISGRLFGICTGFKHSVDYNKKGINSIDSIGPFEILPGVVNVKGEIECTRIGGYGGLEGAGVVASEDDLLLEKYISIVLVDRRSNSVIFKCQDASVTSQNWQVTGRSVLKGSFTFEGLSWNNESEF
jgi:hypothetical protein